MYAYLKVSADDAKGTHGETWVELESGDYMHRIGNDEIAELLVAGEIWSLYMATDDGEIVAKPFENLALFGEPDEPPMRFAKANLALVPERNS